MLFYIDSGSLLRFLVVAFVRFIEQCGLKSQFEGKTIAAARILCTITSHKKKMRLDEYLSVEARAKGIDQKVEICGLCSNRERE